MKKAFAALLFLLLLLSLESALAYKPAGGMIARRLPEEGLTLRGYSIDGPTECVTGTNYTWTASSTASLSPFDYNLLEMTVLDGTYADANMTDTQFRQFGTSNQLSYTFYFPGTYIIWWTPLDSDNNSLDSTLKVITVTDGGPNAVTRKIKSVAAQCKVEGDPYQTILNVHDWITGWNTYDDSYTHFSAESLFLNHTGVCNSYTRAFALILSELGIPVRRVSGYSFGDEDNGHAWNAAKVNGTWCLFDLTWDDTDGAGDDFTDHAYFAVPESVMNIEHTAQHYTGGRVTCSSFIRSYFYVSGLWADPVYDNGFWNDYVTMTNDGCHRFSLEAPVYADDTYMRTLQGEVTALGMTNTSFLNLWDHQITGTFTYDRSTRLITGSHDITAVFELPAQLTKVSREMLRNTRAVKVVIPSSCLSIDADAFYGMDLWEIVVPASVRTIDEDAFAGISSGRVLIIAPSGSTAAGFAAGHGFETAEE